MLPHCTLPEASRRLSLNEAPPAADRSSVLPSTWVFDLAYRPVVMLKLGAMVLPCVAPNWSVWHGRSGGGRRGSCRRRQAERALVDQDRAGVEQWGVKCGATAGAVQGNGALVGDAGGADAGDAELLAVAGDCEGGAGSVVQGGGAGGARTEKKSPACP